MKSNLYGLVGEKLSHSLSPMLHEIILKIVGLEGEYRLYEVPKEELKYFIQKCKNLNIKGLNVTIPYKIISMDYLDEISKEAQRIGSINTILFKDEKAIGYNTDYYGFLQMLDKYDLKIKNKKALILGTGGAARAVLYSLLDSGIDEIYIASRDVNSSKKKFPFDVKIISYDYIGNLRNVEYIINCTPCGMYPNVKESAVTKSIFNNFSVAIDLIYSPFKTLFLDYAEESGLKTFNGLYMLVSQGVISQAIWNDIIIDKSKIDIIFDIVKNNLPK